MSKQTASAAKLQLERERGPRFVIGDELAEVLRLVTGLTDAANGRYRNLPVTAGTMELIARYLKRLLPPGAARQT